MRKNFGAKPFLYPMPVLIIGTYDENGEPDVMNAAFGGIIGSDKILISLGSHKTTENIAKTKAFTVSVADAAHVAECDFVGIVSANKDPEKMKKSGFTTVKSEFVNAPIINELPIALECELEDIIDGHLYVGRIVNASSDERFCGEDELPSLDKFTPITYDKVHLTYVALGETVGKAFGEGAKLK